jgi:hypothetical protein
MATSLELTTSVNKKTISISKDFSETPAGRHSSDGPYSGETFREDYLYPALKQYDQVEVDLDGTLGYGSSFLEEAFGGLIRVKGMTLERLNRQLIIRSSRRLYRERIASYLKDAEKKRNNA